MKFRTEINIDKSDRLIDHDQNILTIGSCFAKNIGEYFKSYRFSVVCNPFGVLYNPISIYNSLKLIHSKKKFKKNDLVEHQGEWHSFYHNSDFSHHDQNMCLEKINNGIISTHDFLKSTDHLIITFGTAFVYRYIKNDMIVSNCHKIPAKEFERYRLSLDETKKTIESIVSFVNSISENISIIFTVSPVRHWKDGAVENQLSKSTLLIAVDEIVKENKNCEYFPSYEIVMDDLRDYRFYDTDLLHPNKFATDYIWDKFSNAKLSNQCLTIMKEV
ncbi:MAG: GSCFA domain-containing protein, partial [Bacteroidota bacterium]